MKRSPRRPHVESGRRQHPQYRAGSVPGYAYSPAMQRSRLVWSEQTLNRFLADPLKTVPGTTMTYAGVPDPEERADLIAYLKRQACNG